MLSPLIYHRPDRATSSDGSARNRNHRHTDAYNGHDEKYETNLHSIKRIFTTEGPRNSTFLDVAFGEATPPLVTPHLDCAQAYQFTYCHDNDGDTSIGQQTKSSSE